MYEVMSNEGRRLMSFNVLAMIMPEQNKSPDLNQATTVPSGASSNIIVLICRTRTAVYPPHILSISRMHAAIYIRVTRVLQLTILCTQRGSLWPWNDL